MFVFAIWLTIIFLHNAILTAKDSQLLRANCLLNPLGLTIYPILSTQFPRANCVYPIA